MLSYDKLKAEQNKDNNFYYSFTLIELLVVVAIIGIFVAVALISVSTASAKARDIRRIGDLVQFSKTLDVYLTANGIYPIWPSGGCTSDPYNPLSTALINSTYLNSLPIDPNSSRYCYYYITDSTGTNYKIAAYLERDTTSASNDSGTASNYYEIYRSAGQQISQVSLTDASLNNAMTSWQTYQDTSLLGWWKMDEDSWTNNCSTYNVLDSSSYSNNGKSCPNITGPVGGETDCTAGKCGLFDGTDDYISIPHNAIFNVTRAITLEAWIKKTGAQGSYSRVIAKRWQYYIAVDNSIGKVTLGFQNGVPNIG
ncbi:MAG: type II secretion system protein [Patescibacteria group bacterium]|nr:type II secretion system protein [Patescibacteria group bacterium]MDD5121748.1 type II secretion system protein [Patescibacteria group bacterium]MDD5222180.1 type II secretion system protein [Patescibacteria group bacterium]MDD5396400.1 type II secretion system protein [Patescibacteria group bacterium]